MSKSPCLSSPTETIRCTRDASTKPGLCQVFFETQTKKGPPPAPGIVRIPRMYGSWTIEPLEAGGAFVSYVL